MKHLALLLVAILLMNLTAACAETAPESGAPRILVAFFSRTGENYNVGFIEKGNTHIIAEMIAEETGGDLFEIKTVVPYPDDYEDTKTIATREYNEGARPELTESIETFEDYDVIFLGYPIWWGGMPMAMYTFMESYDFTGKTVIPFNTHEGSGTAGTVTDIREALPDAEVLDGLPIQGRDAQEQQDRARETVHNWLVELGMIAGE